MSRFTQSANEAAFVAEHVNWVAMCDLDFTPTPVRAHLGVGDIVVNGVTYQGMGEFGSISTIAERPDGRDYTQLVLGLKGVSPEFLALVPDRSKYYGRYASILLVAFDLITYLPIEPIEPAIFEGFMDFMAYERRAGSANITLTVKHFDSIYAESPGIWYTDEHHQSLFSGDLMLDQVAAIQDKQIIWGGASATGGATVIGAGGNTVSTQPQKGGKR